MRAALISLPHPDEGISPELVGKTIAQRQLDFAIQCQCELIVLYAHAFTPEALTLRHQAESAGIRLQLVSNTHSLGGVIGETDSLLVLQTGLLPQSADVIELLGAGNTVLTVPAGRGIQAGFERIDLDRAWAGAMRVPGTALNQLEKLPEDSAPAPTLLRIALQQQLPVTRLGERLLENGDWQIVSAGQARLDQEAHLVHKAIGSTSKGAFSALLARLVLKALGARIAGEKRARLGSAFLYFLLLAAGIAAVWAGSAPVAFLLMALAAPVAHFAIGLARLAIAPFGQVRHWPALRWCGDLAFLAGGMLAIDGFWYRETFAPLVIAASLFLLDRRALPVWAEPLRDRGVIALLACIGTMFMPAEQALIVVSMAVLAANLLPVTFRRG